MTLVEQFHAIVNERMQELGWSRSDLARRMSVTPQQVTNCLNGRNKPTFRTMEAFFRALRLEVSLTFEENPGEKAVDSLA